MAVEVAAAAVVGVAVTEVVAELAAALEVAEEAVPEEAVLVPAEVATAEVAVLPLVSEVTVVELGVAAEETPLMRAMVSDAPATLTPPTASAERRSSREVADEVVREFSKMGAVMAITVRPAGSAQHQRTIKTVLRTVKHQQ